MYHVKPIRSAAAWLVIPLTVVGSDALAQSKVRGPVSPAEQKGTAEEKPSVSAERLQQLLTSGKSALNQGHNVEAAVSFQAAVSQAETLGIGDDRLSRALIGLAFAVHFQGRHAQAEQLAKRALTVDEMTFGAEHPHTASSLASLAWIEFDQGKYLEAERLYRRTLTIREKALGPNHPDVAQGLNNLAAIFIKQRKYAEAEQFAKRSLAIVEKALGPEHPGIAANLTTLAEVELARGRPREAEILFNRSLSLTEKSLGPENPAVAVVLMKYADFLRKIDRSAQGAALEARARAIMARTPRKNAGPPI